MGHSDVVLALNLVNNTVMKHWIMLSCQVLAFCSFHFRKHDWGGMSIADNLKYLSQCMLLFQSLDDILRILYRKVKQQEQIDVRVNRQDLLWDGIRQLRRKKTLEGLLKVQFFGECGIDTGGLRKEFLSGNVYQM